MRTDFPTRHFFPGAWTSNDVFWHPFAPLLWEKNMSNHVASRTRLINRFSVAKQNVSGLQFYFKQVKSKWNEMQSKSDLLTKRLSYIAACFDEWIVLGIWIRFCDMNFPSAQWKPALKHTDFPSPSMKCWTRSWQSLIRRQSLELGGGKEKSGWGKKEEKFKRNKKQRKKTSQRIAFKKKKLLQVQGEYSFKLSSKDPRPFNQFESVRNSGRSWSSA